MTRFFVQDFDSEQGWSLRQAQKFHKDFLLSNEAFLINDYSTGEGEVPVGTVEFVHNYMINNNIPVPKPVNVPSELEGYCELQPLKIKGPFDFEEKVFAKSMDYIKHPLNGIVTKIPEGNWQVTKYLEDGFDSEYRIFVWNKRIVGAKHYCGNAFIAPSKEEVKYLINLYQSAPIAYTLDVGISNRRTHLIECHNFYSCGLYGFSEWQVYPLMLSGWWKEYTRKIKNEN
jgi:hypothetical protein